MAKSNKDNGLATQSNAGALATVQPQVAAIEGTEDTGSNTIPALVLCQGTAEEVEAYGDGKRGKFLDSLDGSVVGEKVNVVICGGFMSWSKWESGSKAPVYTAYAIGDVPPDDLRWTDNGPVRKPPSAVECVNTVVCVQGVEWPFLFRFKRTGLKAYRKVISPLEKRRGLQGKGAGLYELAHTPDKNPDGKPYLRLTAKFAGEVPASMAAQVNAVMTQLEAFKAKAKVAAETDNVTTDIDHDDGIPV